MVRQGHASFTVVLPDKPAFVSQSQFDKAGVADADPLQSQQLFEIERLAAGLSDSMSPALDTVLRRPLALDGIARLGAFQQKKRRCARTHVPRYIGGYEARAARSVHRVDLVERLC